MAKEIDIIIITGFLGAGKTTLLNKLVNSYSDKNIGLLVNDFGKIPVDGAIIKNDCDNLNKGKVYEIGNGSIFCSCLTADFIMGLEYFIKESPDILFIETSGMSDPSSMAKLLKEYKLYNAFKIKHVLCVSDCTNVLKLRAHMTFIDRQIMSSNTILLNKSDLVDIDEQNNILGTFKQLNPESRIEFTNYCEFDYKSLEYKEFRLAGDAESCNTKKSAPKRMNLEQLEVNKDNFTEFLKNLISLTLRIKGFYKLENQYYYFDNNNNDIEVKEVSKEKFIESGITIILLGNNYDEVEKLWADFKKNQITK